MLDIIFSGRNLFVLYLVLAGAFLQPLIPCHSSRLFTDAVWPRHVLGFLTLIFFVVVVDTEIDNYMPFGTILATSIVIYTWFLISSKMTANWWLLLVVLLAALYMVDLYESRIPPKKEDPRTIATLDTTKYALLGAAIVATLIGSLIYVGEKKLEYRGDFNYTTFLFGTAKCKNTPSTRPYLESLKAAFMEAPGRGSQRGGAMSNDAFLTALSTQHGAQSVSLSLN